MFSHSVTMIYAGRKSQPDADEPLLRSASQPPAPCESGHFGTVSKAPIQSQKARQDVRQERIGRPQSVAGRAIGADETLSQALRPAYEENNGVESLEGV